MMELLMASHESIKPTAEGMNITGIMAMRKTLTSRISLTFTHFSSKQQIAGQCRRCWLEQGLESENVALHQQMQKL